MSARLTLVTTPIGNLGDLAPRGMKALEAADLVLCEDTRQTAKLLTLCGLKAPLKRCDEHQEAALVAEVLVRLAQGQNLVLVCDAGTPLISDPGYRLVRAVQGAGFAVTATPGPTAPILALILSGLPSDRFFFGGFLPTKSKARQSLLAELKTLHATLIFFENPKRLAASLDDAACVLGADRTAATARELTKKFEEIQSGTVGSLAQHYAGRPTPKGELVLLFGPAVAQTEAVDLDALLIRTLRKQNASTAARAVARQTGLPRSQVYQRALELKETP